MHKKGCNSIVHIVRRLHTLCVGVLYQFLKQKREAFQKNGKIVLLENLAINRKLMYFSCKLE